MTMQITFKDDGDGEFSATIDRPEDGGVILANLYAPGADLNDGPGWEYSITWDSSADPNWATDSSVLGGAPDRETAEACVRAAIPAAMVLGNESDKVIAAIRAAVPSSSPESVF